ncbi:MAG: hypothetical protein U1E05_13825 [Patescibacteria group bacterium]|nr:hypothetical protein [Patescibacteria group bacterium]
MMRALRRQLRSWRQEFLQTWRRLRSFHRVALGIILAFASMSAADRYLYRPLKASIAEEQEKQKELEVPALVTKPEDDAEIQEAGLRIENAEQSAAKQRAEMAKAVATWPPFTKSDQGAIVAKFNDLIARAGLRCLRFGEGPLPAQDEAVKKTRGAPAPRRAAAAKEDAKENAKKDAKAAEVPAAKSPLNSVVHHCLLAGSFEAIQKFLREAERFEYPARLEKVRLALPDLVPDPKTPSPPVPANTPPEIQLNFELTLYLHE